MSISFTSLVLTLFALCTLSMVNVLLADYTDPVLAKLDLSNPKSYKGNFCQRMEAFTNGNQSELSSALSGTEISIGIYTFQKMNPVFLAVNESGYPIGGWMFQIQQQLALLGGFNLKYIQVSDRPKSQTIKAYMNSIVPYVDFFGPSYFADTVDRRQLGMGFTYPLADSSLFLVTTQARKLKNNTLMAFALPFSPRLWGVIVVVLVVSALLDYWMGGHSHMSFTTYVYYTMMTITTKSKFEPLTRKSKLLNLGLAFFTFIITAAYIANLSNVLITTDVFVPLYSSIEDANAKGARVCVESGSSFQTILTSYYPGVKVVPWPTGSATLGIASGNCDAAAIPSVVWDLHKEQMATNPTCNYVQAGDAIRIMYGAWPYEVDYNNKCTSFVNNVFTAILVQLYTTGERDAIYNDALESSFNVTCSFEPEEEEKAPLGYQNVLGVLMIYFILVGTGGILHISVWAYGRKSRMKQGKGGVEVKRATKAREEKFEHVNKEAEYFNSVVGTGGSFIDIERIHAQHPEHTESASDKERVIFELRRRLSEAEHELGQLRQERTEFSDLRRLLDDAKVTTAELAHLLGDSKDDNEREVVDKDQEIEELRRK